MYFLVGNKDDNPDMKVVLRQDAQRFADQMGIQLFETSAKENLNVEEVHSSYCISLMYFEVINSTPLLHKEMTFNYQEFGV